MTVGDFVNKAARCRCTSVLKAKKAEIHCAVIAFNGLQIDGYLFAGAFFANGQIAGMIVDDDGGVAFNVAACVINGSEQPGSLDGLVLFLIHSNSKALKRKCLFGHSLKLNIFLIISLLKNNTSEAYCMTGVPAM